MTFRIGMNIIVLALIVFLMHSCESGRRLWQVFIYKDGLNSARTEPVIIEAAGPNFKSKEECMTWGMAEAMKYPAGDYECAYNCTYRPLAGTIICEGR